MHSHMVGMQKHCIEFIPCPWVLALALALSLLLALASAGVTASASTSSVCIATGRERLIRSHSSARFCFELSGNSN